VLLRLLGEGKIHPVVAERMPLTDARRAHELLESSADKGKLVLVPGSDRPPALAATGGEARLKVPHHP
jgi:hypothetical protein